MLHSRPVPNPVLLRIALLAVSALPSRSRASADWRELLAGAPGVRAFRIELPPFLGTPGLALEGVIAGSGGESPAGTVLSQELVVGSPDPARNDECAAAVPVESGLVAGNNLRATTSATTGSCGAMGNELWYAYTPRCSGRATVESCQGPAGATLDVAFAVFDGTCGALVELGCDAGPCGSEVEVSWSALAGRTYLVAVGGRQGRRGSFALWLDCAPSVPDPTRLPLATTAQVPLTPAYAALGVPALPAGGSYADPTTGVSVHKLTSATFPASGFRWGHAYAEGGDEVSLPYAGETRAVHVYTSDGSHRLIDFTPGSGVSNPRPLTGALAPWGDLGLSFSNDPSTPHYVYVSTNAGSAIRRFDLRTLAEVPGDGWPVTGETQAGWLHQSEGDEFFVWMRGANGDTVVGYEPSTGTKKTYTNAQLNEPRIDRAGRYVGISMDVPQNGLLVWDWLADTITWSANGSVPFAHVASLKRQWLGVDWNQSYPPDFTRFVPDVPGSVTHVGGPANATLVHGNGNWIQDVADPGDQWAAFLHYGSLRPAQSYWLAPGGIVLITSNGERRLLAHAYNTTSVYTFYSFAKFSPDGRYVLFTSDMNGSGRSDLFLAELPTSP
jgi:hypothetical protein